MCICLFIFRSNEINNMKSNRNIHEPAEWRSTAYIACDRKYLHYALHNIFCICFTVLFYYLAYFSSSFHAFMFGSSFLRYSFLLFYICVIEFCEKIKLLVTTASIHN